jgi:predicted RNA-binding Zn ribbon-like protein
MGGAPPPQAPQRMMTPQLQQQRPGPGPSQQQQQMRRPQQQPPQQQQKMQPQNALPPLPPPNKNAGQLYGIPLHPLIMFQTHDNKLNEHDLMINDCFDQLKDIETRLVVVESSGGGNHPVVTAEPPTSSGAAATDLNELMNDGVFINGIVDNIMTTTNFASIVENIIPLKEENEMLKRRISDQEAKSDQMHMFIQHLEERLKSIENELAQPYEEFPAPAATTTEAVAETVVETSSVAELVAESINDIILSSATASTSSTASASSTASLTATRA